MPWQSNYTNPKGTKGTVGTLYKLKITHTPKITLPNLNKSQQLAYKKLCKGHHWGFMNSSQKLLMKQKHKQILTMRVCRALKGSRFRVRAGCLPS